LNGLISLCPVEMLLVVSQLLPIVLCLKFCKANGNSVGSKVAAGAFFMLQGSWILLGLLAAEDCAVRAIIVHAILVPAALVGVYIAWRQGRPCQPVKKQD